MNKLAPPPRRASRLTVQPPLPIEALDNLTQPTDVGVRQDLNFKVAPDFHHLFKSEAVARRMSMKGLLEAFAKCYFDTHGCKADPERKII